MSVTTRSIRIRKSLNDYTEFHQSKEEIFNSLMEAFESDLPEELLECILAMSEALDGLKDAKTRIQEIIHQSEKVLRALPEEVK